MNLESLKKEAKRWLRSLRAQDPAATQRFHRNHPQPPAHPALRDVQFALARELGFPGWSALTLSVNSTKPIEPSLIDTFLRDACLDWRTGGPDRTRRTNAAGRLLRRHPELATATFLTAVVCGHLDIVERALREQPSRATEAGGPHGWPPLLYLCNARLPVDVDALPIATLLLDHGADPNSFYPGGSNGIRYSALTGVLGRGEEQATMHPQARAFADLLLGRGAEPYDIQVFYNLYGWHASHRHLGDDAIWVLELIREHAIRLGREADWRDPDWKMIDMGGYGQGARYLLRSAIGINHVELAEWALAKGANPNAAPAPARSQPQGTLYQEAMGRGRVEIADLLVRHGAVAGAPADHDEYDFLAACARMNRAQVRLMLANHPEYLQMARPMIQAAELDRVEVMEFLLELGISPDVEAKGRIRPLHAAAYHDSVRVAKLLLARGAEIDFMENEWGSSALGAALWGQKPRMVEMLAPVSRDIWSLVTAGKLERLRELLEEQSRRAQISYQNQSPLFWLPEDEQTAAHIVRLFLDHGCNPALRNEKGKSAADLAADRGLDEAAVILRHAAAQYHERLREAQRDEQAIRQAAQAGDRKVVESLLEKNRDMFRTNIPYLAEVDAQTLIERAHAPRFIGVRTDFSVLEAEAAEAVDQGESLDAARQRIASDFGANSWQRLEQACRLIDAIWDDDVDIVRELIAENPALLHEHTAVRYSNWGPPMSYAANLGRDAIIEMLYSMGARDVESALGRATLQGKIDTARKLHQWLGSPVPPEESLGGPAYTLNVAGTALMLEFGARVVDDEGKPVAPVNVVLETDSRRPDAKHRILEMYVEKGLVLPDTPVMALHRGRIDLLEELVRRDSHLLRRTFTHAEIYPPDWGCRPEVDTQGTPLDGGTLLHLCIDFDELEIARWLIERGADVNARAAIDADGFGGHTPLFGAVVCYANFWRNYQRTIDEQPFAELLLNHGVDSSVRASIRKRCLDGVVREFRDVTPVEWGERYTDRLLVSATAVRLITERLGGS